MVHQPSRSIRGIVPTTPVAKYTSLVSKDDFERCHELRQWIHSHTGERPRRRSENLSEVSLAMWLDRARKRCTEAWNDRPCARKLTSQEATHLTSILAPLPEFQGDTTISTNSTRTSDSDSNPAPEVTEAAEPSTSLCEEDTSEFVRYDPKTVPPQDFWQRCKELWQWLMKHSGQRPSRRSDDQTEESLARWLDRSLIRRTRVFSNRPCARLLTTQEKRHLDNIMKLSYVVHVGTTAAASTSGTATTESNPGPEFPEPTNPPTSDDEQHTSEIVIHNPQTAPTQNHFERSKELEQWFINHSGERPRRRSRNQSEVSLAMWLDRALKRRTNAWYHRPCARQLTTEEKAILNRIIVQGDITAAANIMGICTTILNPVPAGSNPPEHTSNKRLRQNLSGSVEPVPEAIPKRSRTHTTPHNNNNAVTVSLRGLNIQWPFSQLLLNGTKLEEVRQYPLNYRGIAKTQEEVFIVETKGPSVCKERNAISHGIQIPARPSTAQIVGTIRFACSQPYYDKQTFHEARCRHRIKADSKFDWDGHHRLYGWRVDSVRALTVPIPVGRTGQTGFRSRGFSVVFTDKDKDKDR